jgi:hypothetical protein
MARGRIQPRGISAITDVEPSHAGAAPVYHEMMHLIIAGKFGDTGRSFSTTLTVRLDSTAGFKRLACLNRSSL